MSTTAELTNGPKESETEGHQGVKEPARQNQVNEPDAGMLSQIFGGAPRAQPVKSASQLLRSPTLSHPANNPLRVLTLQRAQRTLGNHYAQRLVSEARQNNNKLALPENSGHGPAEGTSSFLEARQNYDFDGVGIYKEKEAAARRDIYFTAGQYAPSLPVSYRVEGLQAKLLISGPGDQLEQEADRVTDQVMGLPDQMVKKKPG
jgi:hypothetical protein